MSIRLRLTLLVAVLVLISATVLAYLASAYLDTRDRLREADTILHEFVQAVSAGSAIARLRLDVLYRQSTGTLDAPSLEGAIGACEGGFVRWITSSRDSIAVGIAGEAEDLDRIQRLERGFHTELEALHRALSAGGAPDPALFDQLLDEGVRHLIEDDLRELSAALDGILLSMGTTPWIARIGPGQLATARATLAEIRAAQMVRDRLHRQSSRVALLLANPGPEIERAILRTSVSLEETLRAWQRATVQYAEVSGGSAPPHYGQFLAEIEKFQREIDQILEFARQGRRQEATDHAAAVWMPALRGELLPILESSLETEVVELREMLGELDASTRRAGAGGIGLICLVLFSALAGAFFTVRTMLRALEQLHAGTEIIGAGNFEHRVHLGSSDELGILGAKFDAMAARLQEQVEQGKRLEQELLQRERLATLGQFIATISHEIRNPLGTIQTAVHSLRKRVSDGGGAIDRTLDRTDRSIQRCDRIIEELLDYTRTREPAPVETDLDPWLAGVLEDFNLPPAIHLAVRLDAGVTLHVDRNRLQGCVVNLLGNACQSLLEMPPDGRALEIRVESTRRGDRVEIRVTDNGPGMSLEVLEKVFEPMFSTRSFGVGLGLPIVKKYMEQHGGGVTIETEPGRGTAALLWLPQPDGAGAVP